MRKEKENGFALEAQEAGFYTEIIKRQMEADRRWLECIQKPTDASNHIIGENFKDILFDETLSSIAKIFNRLNKDLSYYDDEIFSETLDLFKNEMLEVITCYIDSQITTSRNIRTVD